MPNVTAARPIVPIPNTSSSHGPNVTNSDWAAAINPNIPRIASHPPGARWPVGADTAMCCRGGSDPTRTNSSTPATSTPTAPATYAPRHDVSAVTTPSELTPISRPNAQDVSMIPTTRPRRSYGTWSAVHAINPMSNTILVMARTRSPTANQTTPVLPAAIAAPAAMPSIPPVIATRRGTRSTSRPTSGDASPDASAMARATPMSAMSTSRPRAIVAMNGGAYR